MVTNRRKKKIKFRATRSHGCGSHKKNRGAGGRGGRGRAGTGKRGDSNKPKIWGDKKYFGKYGFKYKGSNEVNSVNLKFIEDKFNTLLDDKKISENKGIYEIDVTKLGFDKVLGYGKLSRKYKIQARSFSKDAIEKLKAAGGEAVILKTETVQVEEVKEPKQESKTEAQPKK
ncbi:MAG: uL15m family ribosomal protein [Nanoarchaeota archaeon]|nr:uL15m family ribosomal protein [Nanoarchaeota archaeon]